MRCLIKIDGQWQKEHPDNLSRWMWQHDGEEAVVIDDSINAFFCGKPEMVDNYRAKWDAERKVGYKRRAAMFSELDRALFAKETPIMPDQSPAWCQGEGCLCSEIFQCSGPCEGGK